MRELAARADAQLGEDLAEVVLGGARADEQVGSDLGIRQPVPGQPRDLGLLSSQLDSGFDGALAGGLPGGLQFAARSLGERGDAHRGEHVLRGAQFVPRVPPSFGPAQPLAVEQVSAREVDGHPAPPELADGFQVVALRVRALSQ